VDIICYKTTTAFSTTGHTIIQTLQIMRRARGAAKKCTPAYYYIAIASNLTTLLRMVKFFQVQWMRTASGGEFKLCSGARKAAKVY